MVWKKRSKPKSRNEILRDRLDSVFSKYIRLKYAYSGGICQCVSCGALKDWKEIQNGHYMSRGYMSTRFDEDNCRPQCVSCNMYNQGNIQMYRRRLVSQIGEHRVNRVEVRARTEIRKYADFEYEELIRRYQGEVKRLKEEKQIRQI